jgi:hypothetical protein
MQGSRQALLILFLALASWVAFASLGEGPAPRAAAGAPFGQQVYVWQRAWSEPVRSAVRERGAAFERVVVLSRQIDWVNGTPRILRFNVDWRELKQSPAQAGAALRISSFGGNFENTKSIVARAARELVEEARGEGVTLAEVQIDFDAAASKLDGYALWLAAAQKETGSVPVTITALPSWLDVPAFANLARAASAGAPYVLQVHGLERPETFADTVELCNAGAARKAVEKAAEIGAPFRVALPTYGMLLAFESGATGKLLAVAAEQAGETWGAGKQVKAVEADAMEIAELARLWSNPADRPAALTGMIWYRLPVSGDQWNWRWPTLSAVMSGREPASPSLSVDVRESPDGSSEIRLRNTGEQDANGIERVTLEWKPGALAAADGLAGFEMSRRGDTVQLTAVRVRSQRLRAGEERVIGWARLGGAQPKEKQVEVRSHVEYMRAHPGN